MWCVKFLAKFQNLNFWQFFDICNFDFVFFWLGIWCESLVWVIMRQRGVSQNAGVLVVLVVSSLKNVISVLLELQCETCFILLKTYSSVSRTYGPDCHEKVDCDISSALAKRYHRFAVSHWFEILSFASILTTLSFGFVKSCHNTVSNDTKLAKTYNKFDI